MLVVVSISLDVFGSDTYIHVYVICITNIIKFMHPLFVYIICVLLILIKLCTLCLQVALAGTQIWWTTEVNLSFSRLEEGYENALKDYYKKQVCTACQCL